MTKTKILEILKKMKMKVVTEKPSEWTKGYVAGNNDAIKEIKELLK